MQTREFQCMRTCLCNETGVVCFKRGTVYSFAKLGAHHHCERDDTGMRHSCGDAYLSANFREVPPCK